MFPTGTGNDRLGSGIGFVPTKPIKPRLNIPVQWYRFADNPLQRQFGRLVSIEDRFLDVGGEEGELGPGPDVGFGMTGCGGDLAQWLLYVPHVFSPEKWCVFELPNPIDKETQAQFSVVGRGSFRLRFERR
jgi:hypothetical protein